MMEVICPADSKISDYYFQIYQNYRIGTTHDAGILDII